jgi:hypothetical protein
MGSKHLVRRRACTARAVMAPRIDDWICSSMLIKILPDSEPTGLCKN